MAIERLEYLIQKCKLQLRKKRDSEARVWLEIALDEFPNNRELQRFAGKTYVQLGMHQKAIHFLSSETIEDTICNSIEEYDHDRVTSNDLFIIQEQFNNTEASSFVFPTINSEVPVTIKNTLALKSNVGHSSLRGVETDSICSSRLGKKPVVVKHLKTRRVLNISETVGNDNKSLHTDALLPEEEFEMGCDGIVLSQEIGSSLKSTVKSVREGDSSSLSCMDELQDVPDHRVYANYEKVDTDDVALPASCTEFPFSQSTYTEDIELENDGYSEIFNGEKDAFLYGAEPSEELEQVLQLHDTFQFEKDEDEWNQDSAGLELYQDDDALLDFSEESCELFDVTDDVFFSTFEEFDFDEDFEDERHSIHEVNDSGKIKLTRWERAQQVAVEVIYSTNWFGKHLAFLTDVFFESGWGAARVTIEKEILSGTTIDELMLAREFKELWKNCDRYWITLSKLGPSNHVTEATHKQMSWAQALKIIRCFNWLPSIEELEVFLDDEFEYWYQNALMRRVFPIFMKYLCYYRARNNPYMDFELGPYQQELSDDPMDHDDLINYNSEIRQRLRNVGLYTIKVNIH
ncbi:tetratricopeptide repeat protein [Vibrio vulnificus]|uniref:tetratricopeptide repeat protein n=1 Tax=Vibrio vulnificus TaxID=672 RepID=UPI00310673AA